MNKIVIIGLVLAMPVIALLELLIISFIITLLDTIFDDLIILKETISNFFGGDKK